MGDSDARPYPFKNLKNCIKKQVIFDTTGSSTAINDSNKTQSSERKIYSTKNIKRPDYVANHCCFSH